MPKAVRGACAKYMLHKLGFCKSFCDCLLPLVESNIVCLIHSDFLFFYLFIYSFYYSIYVIYVFFISIYVFIYLFIYFFQ